MGSSSHLRRCQFNCLADSNVGHAAANTARHHRVNVAVTGIGEIFQQRGCRHDLSRLAIAALGNLQLEPRGLQRMLALRIKAFDRGDVCPGDRPNRGNAGSRCASFHMHRASTTKTDPTTEFRSCETKLVADYPEQRRVVRTVGRNGAAVEIECGHDRLTPLAFRQWYTDPSRRMASPLFSRSFQVGNFVRALLSYTAPRASSPSVPDTRYTDIP